jgi:hypothetical protein
LVLFLLCSFIHATNYLLIFNWRLTSLVWFSSSLMTYWGCSCQRVPWQDWFFYWNISFINCSFHLGLISLKSTRSWIYIYETIWKVYYNLK